MRGALAAPSYNFQVPSLFASFADRVLNRANRASHMCKTLKSISVNGTKCYTAAAAAASANSDGKSNKLGTPEHMNLYVYWRVNE